MKPFLTVVLAALAGALVALAVNLLFLQNTEQNMKSSGETVVDTRLADLERKILQLSERIDALNENKLIIASAPPRENSSRPSVDPTNTGNRSTDAERDPRWYLEQYVLSFENGGSGSEYFRLAVDAFASKLLSDITKIIGDDGAHRSLRIALIQMVANVKFHGSVVVIDALLLAIRNGSHDDLVVHACQALEIVGTTDTAVLLEQIAWSVRKGPARAAAIGAAVRLAGADANKMILRLLMASPDEATTAFLLNLLNGLDHDAALKVFQYASGQPLETRLPAADQIHKFRSEPFYEFIEHWISFERDPGVVAKLKSALAKKNEKRSWSAKQAAGPPDVNDPTRDDVRAWASSGADMGEQWLELTYANPVRASAVRIYEVCVAGAVTSVTAIDTKGNKILLWSGVDPTTVPGVFEITFNETANPIRAVRIVLDTNRSPGWSEIDAVEIAGSRGSAFASDATASSAYDSN